MAQAAGSTFTMESVDVILYAQWSVKRYKSPEDGLIFYDRDSYTTATATVPS